MIPESEGSPYCLSRRLVRDLDQAAIEELGLPSLLLMENAARGVAEVLLQQNPKGRIIVLCGPGNNGGDGLAVTRLLSANGLTAEAWLVRNGKDLSSDAAANLAFLQKAGLPVYELSDRRSSLPLHLLQPDDWIVDALLGTGLTGSPRDPYTEIIQQANQSLASTLAVDLPSGMDCDTGQSSGACMKAAITVTFVARKQGFDNPESVLLTGAVHVRHIGIPETWLRNWISRRISPARDA